MQVVHPTYLRIVSHSHFTQSCSCPANQATLARHEVCVALDEALAVQPVNRFCDERDLMVIGAASGELSDPHALSSHRVRLCNMVFEVLYVSSAVVPVDRYAVAVAIGG